MAKNKTPAEEQEPRDEIVTEQPAEDNSGGFPVAEPLTAAPSAAHGVPLRSISDGRALPDRAVNTEKFCVYLGPTLRGVIQTGTVYPGTREDAKQRLASVIAKYPQVAQLIVSDKTLVQDRVKIKTPGNALYVKYQRFVSELNNKEDK